MHSIGEKFERIVIILSTGRTGTMSLAQYFDAYPQVRALHEPRPSRRLRVASNLYMAGKIRQERLANLLTRCRRKLLASIDEPIYVEANMFMHGFMGVLDEVYGRERTKAVHIVRDPRSWICSFADHALSGRKALVARWLPYWLLKPEQHRVPSELRWGRMQPAERIAWLWTAWNEEMNRGQELLGERYLQMRFEDIFAPDGAGLAKLTGWVGLEPRQELVAESATHKANATRTKSFPRFKEWPADVQQRVMEMCGPLMEQYGYKL